MIQAEEFVERARRRGFGWYAGVPCSFLTPFINYTIADKNLHYISSANEGDAVATGAGATLGGRRAVVMMQNSGLGNAINPITSLAHTFRIPLLLIVTLRGDPELSDEPQHELMGRITRSMLDQVEVPWAYFPTQVQEIDHILSRAEAYMEREQRPYALVMRKGSVAPYSLPDSQDRVVSQYPEGEAGIIDSRRSQQLLSRAEVLRRVIELTPQDDTAIIATTGFAGRELYALADRPNQFYMVGSMGCASSLGLGLALARPDLRVLVVDGDGAALMRMGSFATIGAYGKSNLIHLLLDNEVHESTGGQATVSAGVSFARIAEACGYGVAMAGRSLELVDELLGGAPAPGPRFGHLKIRRGVEGELPRPRLSPTQVLERLMRHFGTLEKTKNHG